MSVSTSFCVLKQLSEHSRILAVPALAKPEVLFSDNGIRGQEAQHCASGGPDTHYERQPKAALDAYCSTCSCRRPRLYVNQMTTHCLSEKSWILVLCAIVKQLPSTAIKLLPHLSDRCCNPRAVLSSWSIKSGMVSFRKPTRIES